MSKDEQLEQNKRVASLIAVWLSSHTHSTNYFAVSCCGGRYDVLRYDTCGYCGKQLPLPEDVTSCINEIREILEHAPAES